MPPDPSAKRSRVITTAQLRDLIVDRIVGGLVNAWNDFRSAAQTTEEKIRNLQEARGLLKADAAISVVSWVSKASWRAPRMLPETGMTVANLTGAAIGAAVTGTAQAHSRTRVYSGIGKRVESRLSPEMKARVAVLSEEEWSPAILELAARENIGRVTLLTRNERQARAARAVLDLVQKGGSKEKILGLIDATGLVKQYSELIRLNHLTLEQLKEAAKKIEVVHQQEGIFDSVGDKEVDAVVVVNPPSMQLQPAREARRMVKDDGQIYWVNNTIKARALDRFWTKISPFGLGAQTFWLNRGRGAEQFRTREFRDESGKKPAVGYSWKEWAVGLIPVPGFFGIQYPKYVQVSERKPAKK
jgi:hypothetical protein